MPTPPNILTGLLKHKIGKHGIPCIHGKAAFPHRMREGCSFLVRQFQTQARARAYGWPSQCPLYRVSHNAFSRIRALQILDFTVPREHLRA